METIRGWSNEAAGASTARVIAEVGLSTYNRVWTEPEPLPTLHEIRTPDSWSARLQGPASDADPSGSVLS